MQFKAECWTFWIGVHLKTLFFFKTPGKMAKQNGLKWAFAVPQTRLVRRAWS